MRLRPSGWWTTEGNGRALAARGIVLGLAVLVSGCLSSERQKQELLEAELRCQERHIQEMKAELDRKEGVLHALDVELERAQQAAAKAKPDAGDPAPVVQVVKEITLGRLTGGVRQNVQAQFDDALQVILVPRDAEGHALKAPGAVHVDLFEITPQGLKTPLSSWDVTSRELRRLWDEPLLGGAAYRITLPWKALPSTERLRVVVRFTTLDGKLFEAERDFTIRLPAGVIRPGLPVGLPGGYCPPAQRAGDPRVDEQLAAPQASDPRAQPLRPAPPPPAAEGPPPVPGTIPQIDLPPREFPAKSAPSDTPPPLPAAPTPPTFEETKSTGREALPPPRTTPQTDNPILPGVPAVPLRQGSPTTPLTSPPPASWRERQNGLVQVSHSDEPPIRLARPVRK